MHLIRLLISGIHVLREGKVTVQVGAAREQLLAIKRGELTFDEADVWRKQLQLNSSKPFSRLLCPSGQIMNEPMNS